MKQKLIFISYRRDDSAEFASDLFSRLQSRYGKDCVFMDTANIRVGEKWEEIIENALIESSILVAVIGPEWVSIEREGKARIKHDDDWVRAEIRHAIEHSKKIYPLVYTPCGESISTLIPSSNQVPEDLSGLASWQSVAVRCGYINNDLIPLFESLDKYCRRPFWLNSVIALALIAVVLVLVGGAIFWPEPTWQFSSRGSQLELTSVGKAGDLLAISDDPERGLFQVMQDGQSLFRWKATNDVFKGNLHKIEFESVKGIVLTELNKTDDCGSRLNRVIAASQLQQDFIDLGLVCTTLRGHCLNGWKSAPPSVQKHVLEKINEVCP